MKRRISVAVWLLAVFMMAFAGPVLTHAAPFAYITDKDANSVTVIDLSDDSVKASITTGLTAPIGIAVNQASSRAYVANDVSTAGVGTVSVIDTSSNTIVGSPINVGAYPLGIAVTPDGSTVYVANSGTFSPGTVSVISSGTVTATLNVGDSPYGVAVNPAGTRVYVADDAGHSFSVIDATTNPPTVLGTIDLGAVGTGSPYGIAVTPDGAHVYVANSGGDSVSVIQTSDNTVIKTISLASGASPFGITVTPDGAHVYVANNGNGTVSVIQTSDNTVVGTPIAVGGGPYGIDVAGTFVYVVNRTGNSMSVINTADNSVAPAWTNVGNTPSGFGKFILSGGVPTVTTTAISGVTATTAISGGNVTSDGGASVTARGVCWATTANPTVGGACTTNGTGTGSFVSNITGLTGGQTYHVRAYATNTSGTGYGSDLMFSSTAVAPTVTTTAITVFGATTATLGGNVTADGGASVSARGVCYGLTLNPALGGGSTCVSIGSGTGVFSNPITGLTQGTLYHVRAYGTNTAGTGYGSDTTFTTLTLPTVTTTAVSAITSTTATSGGNVTADGGAAVTARGVCWATTANPAVGGTCTTDASGTGVFVSAITGLTSGQIYHVRAYATSTAGTGYGADVQFTTLAIPTVTTAAITVFGSTTATLGGNVTADGGVSVSDRGVCYGLTLNPALGGGSTCVSIGTGTGAFSSPITGLTVATLYHVRAYGTNSVGTAYGADVQFTTSAALPTVTTTAVSAITSTTATSGGNVTADGGAAVSARGVCWATTANPAVGGTCTTDASGTGVFVSAITGLTSGQIYHVRAYATSTAGTGYGADVQFTTLAIPTVTTAAITGLSSTGATSGGNVTADGGAAVAAKGICYGTSANPAIGGGSTCSNDGTGTGVFVSNISGLTTGLTYHVRAYATNTVGTGYGADVQFTTLAIPTVTTAAVSAITSTTATSGGNVTADGGAAVSARGVCWATTSNPVVGGTCTTDGSGTGAFVSAITGLTPAQIYHVRAYATNTVGTAYGADVQFTASAALPTVTTTAVSAITSTTATSGGNVTADGGAAVSARGVCWATTANPAVGGTCTTDGSGTGAFVSAITGLTSGQIYHVRAYATSTAGTGYGADVQFTTLALPTVTTTAVSAITSTTATSGGNVTADGGAAVSARGVCWATTANPAVGGTCTTDGSGTGAFVSAITGLTSGQIYHVRAYATNTVGTAYGTDVQFTTLALPTVTTTAVSAITSTTATSGGNVTADGGAAVSVKGVCWATTANPVVGGTCTSNGTGTGAFVSAITGLTPGQTYHVRAYATNTVGTAYGADVQFSALAVLPTVTTTTVTGITSRGATSGGNVTADGGAAVSARGVCWATTANPAVGGTCTTNGTGTGAFVSLLQNLTPNTLYHVRAYATNSVGTAYGTDVQFTASAEPSKIGIFRGGAWYMDLPGTYTWVACGTDGCYSFGISGDIPVMGDWDGTGIMRIGVFRNGSWYLDMNGNDAWDGSDASIPFGAPGDIPVVGNWNGSADGKTKIGIVRNGTWYLDYAGTYATTRVWAGCGAPLEPTKAQCISFGVSSDMPVVGNWNGSADGQSKIGVFRNGTWYLDYAGTYATSGTWAGCGAPTEPTKAACITFGVGSDVPVVGNWNGSANGQSKIGVFRSGMWYLDYAGIYATTGVWAGCGAPTEPTKEVCAAWGAPGDIPVVTK